MNNVEWFSANDAKNQMRKVTVINDMKSAQHFLDEPRKDYEYAEAVLLTSEKAGLAAIIEERDGETFIVITRIVRSDKFPGYFEERNHGYIELLVRDRYLYDHYHELTPDEFLSYAFEHDTYLEGMAR